MKILREIWNESTIREETEDQWGRKGRGITIHYLNPDLANEKYISEKEYLDKVKTFDNLLKSDLLSDAECGNDKVENARTWNAIIKANRRRLRDIFGDFEKWA